MAAIDDGTGKKTKINLHLQDADWDGERPSQDHSDRFWLDQYLRQHGFAIEWRETHSEPQWSRCREHFTQSQAVAIANDE